MEKSYKLIMDVELNSESPLDAAKEILQWILDGYKPSFYVIDTETRKVVSVDLEEEDDEAVLDVDDDSYIFDILN